MRKFLLALTMLATLTVPSVALAADQEVYARGKVLEVIAEGECAQEAGGADQCQTLRVELLSGPEANKTVTITFTTAKQSFERQKLHKGDTVVVGVTDDVRGITYYVLDVFRLPVVAVLFVLFFVLAAFFGRAQGARSVLGLGISLLILMAFVVPRIFAGDSPVLICAIGSALIAIASILISHGIHRRSFVALAATLLALAIAFIFASLAVHFTTLSGSGTEEAVFLQINYLSGIDLRGLLLGGMVIGALGVLDDVTTAQVAAVEEIHNANESLDAKELYSRGSSIGREHIASLVNTLALAYVGASFPIFLLLSVPDNPPLWVLLNTEQFMEEAVRALVGGSALILAVPISTLLASLIFSRLPAYKSSKAGHHHY